MRQKRQLYQTEEHKADRDRVAAFMMQKYKATGEAINDTGCCVNWRFEKETPKGLRRMQALIRCRDMKHKYTIVTKGLMLSYLKWQRLSELAKLGRVVWVVIGFGVDQEIYKYEIKITDDFKPVLSGRTNAIRDEFDIEHCVFLPWALFEKIK